MPSSAASGASDRRDQRRDRHARRRNDRDHRDGRPRRPRFGPFIVTGGLLGLVVAAVVAALAPRNPAYEPSHVLFYLGIVTVLVGGLLGGGLALLLDRRADGPTDTGT